MPMTSIASQTRYKETLSYSVGRIQPSENLLLSTRSHRRSKASRAGHDWKFLRDVIQKTLTQLVKTNSATSISGSMCGYVAVKLRDLAPDFTQRSLPFFAWQSAGSFQRTLALHSHFHDMDSPNEASDDSSLISIDGMKFH